MPELAHLLSSPKTGQLTDVNLGYAGYVKMKSGESISEYYSQTNKLSYEAVDESGKKTTFPLSHQSVVFRAKVMLGILVISAFFWLPARYRLGLPRCLLAC